LFSDVKRKNAEMIACFHVPSVGDVGCAATLRTEANERRSAAVDTAIRFIGQPFGSRSVRSRERSAHNTFW